MCWGTFWITGCVKQSYNFWIRVILLVGAFSGLFSVLMTALWQGSCFSSLLMDVFYLSSLIFLGVVISVC